MQKNSAVLLTLLSQSLHANAFSMHSDGLVLKNKFFRGNLVALSL